MAENSTYKKFYIFSVEGIQRLLEVAKKVPDAVNLFLLLVFVSNTNNCTLISPYILGEALDRAPKSMHRYIEVLTSAKLVDFDKKRGIWNINANIVMRRKTKERCRLYTADEAPLSSTAEFFKVNGEFFLHLINFNTSNGAPLTLLLSMMLCTQKSNSIEGSITDFARLCDEKEVTVYKKMKALQDANLVRRCAENHYIINPTVVFKGSPRDLDKCEFGTEQCLKFDKLPKAWQELNRIK